MRPVDPLPRFTRARRIDGVGLIGLLVLVIVVYLAGRHDGETASCPVAVEAR